MGGLIVLLLILALVFGGLGLLVERLLSLLMIAGILVLASMIFGFRGPRTRV